MRNWETMLLGNYSRQFDFWLELNLASCANFSRALKSNYQLQIYQVALLTQLQLLNWAWCVCTRDANCGLNGRRFVCDESWEKVARAGTWIGWWCIWYDQARFKSTKKRFQIFFNFTKITISALFKFSFQFISFVTANNSNIAKNFSYAALELSNFDLFRAYEFISNDLMEASFR